MLWLVVEPTYFCETEFTRWPSLILYADGTTLVSDGIGAGCAKLPQVGRGHVDVGRVRSLADAYFSSAEARVAIDSLPVYDAAFQVLTYQTASGRQVKRVYAPGAEAQFTASVPPAQLPARKAFATLITAIRNSVEDRGVWTPDRLAVVRRDLRGEPNGSVDPAAPAAWPATLTGRWTQFLDPRRALNGDECLGLEGAGVAAVLMAHRDRIAKAWWLPGRTGKTLLRLGYVVPGWSPCRTP